MKAPLAPSSQFYYVDTSNTKSLSNESNLENKQDQQQYHHVSSTPSSPPHLSKTDSPFSPDATKTTTSLMRFIGDVTIKRRQIRRKYRCGNLLAEAVLSNALREAKKELARKQEEKRRNLHSFTYNVTINYSSINTNSNIGENIDSNNYNSNNNNIMVSSKDLVLDSTLQNCLSSLDSFFNELKDIKT